MYVRVCVLYWSIVTRMNVYACKTGVTRGAVNKLHNSRWSLGRLTVYDYRREWKEQPRWNIMAVQRDCSNILAASSNAFTLCDPVTLTFDLLT